MPVSRVYSDAERKNRRKGYFAFFGKNGSKHLFLQDIFQKAVESVKKPIFVNGIDEMALKKHQVVVFLLCLLRKMCTIPLVTLGNRLMR